MRTTSGQLRHYWHSGSGSWSSYDELGTIDSNPAAAAPSVGRLDVFARQRDGLVYTRVYWPGHGWGSWLPLPGPVIGAPDASTWGGGRLDLVARDAHGTVVHRYAENGRWSGWLRMGAVGTSDPSAVSWSSGRFDVFVRGTANDLRHIWWDSTHGWSRWESLGGVLTASPDVASWGPGRLDVFVAGIGSTLYQRTYDAAGGGWSAWRRLPGTLGASPGAVSAGRGSVDMFYRDNDARLVHYGYTSGGAPASSGVRGGIVALAQSKLGVGETPDGSNCTPFEPAGTCLPWCTYFATWVWHHVDSSLPYLSYSGSVVQWAVGNRRWKAGPGGHPLPGDIIVYGTSSTSTVHTGIVESVGSDGRITTIEGNSSDKVSHVGPFDPYHPTYAPAPVLGYASATSIGGSLAGTPYRPPAPTLAQIRSQDGGR